MFYEDRPELGEDAGRRVPAVHQIPEESKEKCASMNLRCVTEANCPGHRGGTSVILLLE
jgi:hypothetical protein